MTLSLHKLIYLKPFSKNFDHLLHKYKNFKSLLTLQQGGLGVNKSTTSSNYCSTASRDVAPIKMTYSSFEQTSAEKVSPFPPIVIMHGLLGSKNNWKSLGKAINQKTGRIVFTVDARNHGESPHSNELNYYCLAEDIIYFLKEHSLSKACLIGHSMGGKAVMAVALHNPSVVEKLFVLDISPIGISDSISSLPAFVDIMRNVNIPAELDLHLARKLVDNLLVPLVPEAGVRMFLLANLLKAGNRFAWKVNLNAIAQNFHPHITTFPPAEDGKPFLGETYFIGGGKSNYIKASDHDEIRTLFPRAKFSYIDEAGHWLHADKPKEFLDTIVPLINSS